MKTDGFLGRSPEDLSLREQRSLAGKWIALLRYAPENLALRRIEAIGDSPSECIQALRAAGKDPSQFEYVALTP